MEGLISRLADMSFVTPVVVRPETPVGQVNLEGAKGPGWVVGVAEDGAVAAVVPADEMAGLPESTPVSEAAGDSCAVVVAHPECSVVAAISSWAFTRAAEWAGRGEGASVVFVLRDDAGVVGVWVGEDLDEVAEIGSTRVGADLTLPGDIHIPEFVRRCAFRSGKARCNAIRSFAEPPSGPVPCVNPRKLPEHGFQGLEG